MPDVIQNIDWSILHGIQNVFNCGFMDFLMPKITMLGNKGLIWIAAAIILICTKKYRKCGIVLLAGLVVGLLVGNVLLKNIVARARPSWIEDTFELLIKNPADYSFPSGHTLSSTIAATLLTLFDRRFGYAAIPLAVLIAFSRLYLYVHFPSDVLSAAILGFIIALAVFGVYKKIDKLHKIKKASVD